jgi:hypothetical protein
MKSHRSDCSVFSILFLLCKNESRFMRSPCCLYVCALWISPSLTFECLQHSLRNSICISWHLSHHSGVLHKSLPSVFVSVCISLLTLLGNISVNTFPQQRIRATVEKLLEASFLCGPCLIEGESVALSHYCCQVKTWQRGSRGNKELLGASFSMRSVLNRRKMGH